MKDKFATERALVQAQLKKGNGALGELINSFLEDLHGEDGKTPVKGKDYFTPEEIDEFKSEIESRIRVPEDGKDGVVDYDLVFNYIIQEIGKRVAEIPPAKDGKDGKDGKDAVVDTKAIVSMVLGALPKDDDTEVENLKDYIDKRIKEIPQPQLRMASGSSSLRALTDVDISGLSQDAQGNYILGGSGASVSDEAYGGSWDGVTDEAPSKNAIFDKIESLFGGSFTVATSTEINTGTDNQKGITPLGINESVYRRIYQVPTEPSSPEDGDLWVDTSNAIPFYNAELNVIHQGQHTQYLDGVSASEIFRYILPTGQKLVLTGIEVLERGGGSQNDNFTVQIYDVTNAAQLAICSLNQSSTLAVTTDAAITYSLRVTNGAGTDKDACYAIRGYYIYGS